MGGETVVAAKDDGKKKYDTLKQEQKLDNTDKGNPHDDLIKKVADAATDAASDAAAQVVVDHLSGKEVQPTTPTNPEVPAQVVSSSEESQTLAQPAPAEATEAVKEEPSTQEVSTVKSSKLTFDASKGKWVVEHPQFKSPMVFSSKEDAQKVALTLRANDVPQVEFDPEAKNFEVSHKDWETPVTVTTPEEAKSVVASKLVTLGSNEAEAQAEATEIVDEAAKPVEEVVAAPEVAVESSVQVKAGDVKQNPKPGVDGEFVSGMPPGAAEKKSGPKGAFPDIPGRVVTIPTPPQAPSGGNTEGGVLKTQHSGDYASLSKQALAEVNKMRSKNGLTRETIKLASTEEGVSLLVNLFTLAARVGIKKVADAVDEVATQNPVEAAPAEAAPVETTPVEPVLTETPAEVAAA